MFHFGLVNIFRSRRPAGEGSADGGSVPTYLNTESLRAAITNFRALRELDSSWKMWVENKALQLHVTAPDGWKSQASFYADESLGEQATAFLNAEYERWIARNMLKYSVPLVLP